MATDTLTTPQTLSYGPTKVFKNFIDGEWVEASTGQTFENRNPADTRDLVGIFQKSAKADVDAAVDAAKRAFAKWRLVPAPRRAEIVFRAAEILIERKEDYARDMTREMGKVLAETRGDVQEAIDMTFFMAGEGRRQLGLAARRKPGQLAFVTEHAKAAGRGRKRIGGGQTVAALVVRRSMFSPPCRLSRRPAASARIE